MSQSIGHAQRRVGRIGAVKGRVPVSTATIWRWVKTGKFPAPFKLGDNVTCWDLDEIDAFLAQRAAGGATT